MIKFLFLCLIGIFAYCSSFVEAASVPDKQDTEEIRSVIPAHQEHIIELEQENKNLASQVSSLKEQVESLKLEEGKKHEESYIVYAEPVVRYDEVYSEKNYQLLLEKLQGRYDKEQITRLAGYSGRNGARDFRIMKTTGGKLGKEGRWNKLVESFNVILNYRHCRISDLQSSSARNYSEVIQVLIEKASYLRKFPKPLCIILAENYLQDEGVPAICKVILDNKPLQDNLVKIDLSNNRFTDKSLPSLKEIVVACPKLEIIDISINYVNYAAFSKVFGSLPDLQRKKVEFSVY